MGRSPQDNITISQVASRAGVSRATVSRVMNGHATVASAIADRVRSAATALNYRPSNVARSLSLGRTQMVSVVVPDLSNPMFQQVLRGVTQAAGLDGYRVLVAETGENVDGEADLALEARLRCDALVLVSPRSGDATLQALLAQVQPVVLVNRSMPCSAGDHAQASGSTVPSISVDYATAIATIAEHLIDLGHRHLVYLCGPPNSASHRARLEGLAVVSATHPDVLIRQLDCGSFLGDGHRVARDVLDSQATAALAFNDLVALGLLAGLRELGVAVPQQLSVTGLDDIELAAFAEPPLTTAHVPQFSLGQQAWRSLQATINHQPVERREPVQPELVVRGSTAPPPTR